VTTDRAGAIEQLLVDAFSPMELLVKDQGHLHAGHDGAKDGKGHFDVTIISDVFSGCSRIQRHRMVYNALGGLMATDIHALRINAYIPSERD
jgi:BolA protein